MKHVFFNILMMLVIIMFFFAQVGVHVFGGKINSMTPDVYSKVSGGSDERYYERSNFNDFGNSLIM